MMSRPVGSTSLHLLTRIKLIFKLKLYFLFIFSIYLFNMFRVTNISFCDERTNQDWKLYKSFLCSDLLSKGSNRRLAKISSYCVRKSEGRNLGETNVLDLTRWKENVDSSVLSQPFIVNTEMKRFWIDYLSFTKTR